MMARGSFPAQEGGNDFRPGTSYSGEMTTTRSLRTSRNGAAYIIRPSKSQTSALVTAKKDWDQFTVKYSCRREVRERRQKDREEGLGVHDVIRDARALQ